MPRPAAIIQAASARRVNVVAGAAEVWEKTHAMPPGWTFLQCACAGRIRMRPAELASVRAAGRPSGSDRSPAATAPAVDDEEAHAAQTRKDERRRLGYDWAALQSEGKVGAKLTPAAEEVLVSDAVASSA